MMPSRRRTLVTYYEKELAKLNTWTEDLRFLDETGLQSSPELLDADVGNNVPVVRA